MNNVILALVTVILIAMLLGWYTDRGRLREKLRYARNFGYIFVDQEQVDGVIAELIELRDEHALQLRKAREEMKQRGDDLLVRHYESGLPVCEINLRLAIEHAETFGFVVPTYEPASISRTTEGNA